jgi:hypothetical protein
MAPFACNAEIGFPNRGSAVRSEPRRGRMSGRAHNVDPAIAAHLFDAVLGTRDNEPHLPLLLVSHMEHGHVEGGDATRVGVECVGQVQGSAPDGGLDRTGRPLLLKAIAAETSRASARSIDRFRPSTALKVAQFVVKG